MVSMKQRSRASIKKVIDLRANKFAMVTDDSDIYDKIDQAIRSLDEKMFNPRTTLLLEPGKLVDVTDLNIDEITNVYYPPKGENNFMFGELGIIPFISRDSRFSTLEGVIDYLNLKTDLNLMNRQLELLGDWHLFPLDIDGKQNLQLRTNYDMVQVEYLSHLSADDDEWELYENEYQFVLELAWILLNVYNAEALSSAIGLGVGKEHAAILSHWTSKQKELVDSFVDSSIITYIQ